MTDSMQEQNPLTQRVRELVNTRFSAFDFLPGSNFEEKATSLVLERMEDTYNSSFNAACSELRNHLSEVDVEGLKVVVLGGGTGLSNIIGGDSRRPGWKENPFTGMKEVFPRLHSIVCVTDDGGSTGELLKDTPLIALGDLRHVLLAAVRKERLISRYGLDEKGAYNAAVALHALFNYRFISRPSSADQLLSDSGADLNDLPVLLQRFLRHLAEKLFVDNRITPSLSRPQCLGNLLMAAAVYTHLDPQLDQLNLVAHHKTLRTATISGLEEIGAYIGAGRKGVLPCTTTQSQLQVLYTNGVMVTSESKSGSALRGYPVDRVQVCFSRTPYVQPDVVRMIAEADIIVLAPGSLYTSIIPILQVPGLSDAIRRNKDALKLLVANIWVQTGETDAAHGSPERKFYVSDLIQAYHRNIPGGVGELFSCVLSLNMREIPGATLQRYALESKEPIYLDRERVERLGFNTIAARTFSEVMLHNRGIIQHDPDALAVAVKTLWGLKTFGYLRSRSSEVSLSSRIGLTGTVQLHRAVSCIRYEKIRSLIRLITTEKVTVATNPLAEKMEETQRNLLLEQLVEIIWLHPDIMYEHLQYFQGIVLIDPECWGRCQQWDNVFSFYDPTDGKIKIRSDQAGNLNRFEIVFIIALGQSLLGNYARKKEMIDIEHEKARVGRMYRLTLRETSDLKSFLDMEDITTYLSLCKMCPSGVSPRVYNRVVNPGAMFTPPGLFFGLFYAWYLDNRFTPNIDYKMSIMKNNRSEFIPEQVRVVEVRKKTIGFFRERIFRQRLAGSILYEREREATS